MDLLKNRRKEKNAKRYSDRIIAENCFGGICQIWTIMSNIHRWKEGTYGLLLTFYVGITNVHIMWNPLRVNDPELFRPQKSRVYCIDSDLLEKRPISQEKYWAKRLVSMNSQF